VSAAWQSSNRISFRPGLHERTKCVRRNERHDTAVEIERTPKIKARHDVRQEGRVPRMLGSIDFFLFLQQRHDARYNGRILCARVAQA
jgi:hypothetical protein